jgi:hypothetical protein
MKNICTMHLTREVEDKETHEVKRMINFEALKEFLKAVSSVEIGMYQEVKIGERASGEKYTIFDAQFMQFKNMTVDPLALKRFYYTHVYKMMRETDPHRPGDERPSDRDLYKLEMEMALAYMRSFVWYYYYQSGYYMNGLEDTQYKYAYPPLYNSLYILLDKAGPEELRQFVWREGDPTLEPFRRTHNYFVTRKYFPEVHHYMILQKRDFLLLHPDFADQINTEADIKHYETISFKTRPIRDLGERDIFHCKRSTTGYDRHPFINVEEILETFGPDMIGYTEDRLIEFDKREKKDVDETKNVNNAFRIKGKAEFGVRKVVVVEEENDEREEQEEE